MHDPIAIRMATESTRRGLTEPPREPRVRRPRRAVARVLVAVASRLDPGAVSVRRRTAAG